MTSLINKAFLPAEPPLTAFSNYSVYRLETVACKNPTRSAVLKPACLAQQPCHCQSHLDHIFLDVSICWSFWPESSWVYDLCCCHMNGWLHNCMTVQVLLIKWLVNACWSLYRDDETEAQPNSMYVRFYCQLRFVICAAILLFYLCFYYLDFFLALYHHSTQMNTEPIL